MRCFAYLFDTNNHVGGLHDGVDFLPLQDEWLDVALSLEAQQCTEVAEAPHAGSFAGVRSEGTWPSL